MKTHNILMVLTMATALMVFGVGCVTPAQTDRANATVTDVGNRVSDTTAAVGKVGPTIATSLMRAGTDLLNGLRAIVDAAIGRPAPVPTAATPPKADANGISSQVIDTAAAPPERSTLRGEDVSTEGWQPQAKQELRDKLASASP